MSRFAYGAILLVLAAAFTVQAEEVDNYRKAALKARETGDYDQAVEYLLRATAVEPHDNDLKKVLYDVYVEGAIEHWSKSNQAKALNWLQEATRVFAGAIEPRFLAAKLYMEMGEVNEAERELRVLLDLKDDHGEARFLLGTLLYKKGDLAAALVHLERALDLGVRTDYLIQLVEKVKREQGVESSFGRDKDGQFRIRFEEDRFESMAEQVLDLFDDARFEVGRSLDFHPHRTVQIILYDGAQFQEATTFDPSRIGGLFDGKIRIPVKRSMDTASLKKTIFHEYTHLLLTELTAGHAPWWVQEGFAQWEAGEIDSKFSRLMAEAWMKGPLVEIKDLSGLSVKTEGEETLRICYFTAYAAVDYLKGRYSRSNFKRFFESLERGDRIETALRDGFNLTFERLQTRVDDHIVSYAYGIR